jgi:hypothetical protein
MKETHLGRNAGSKTVIEGPKYEALLEENRLMLARLAERHDLGGVREIEIGSRYTEREAARYARKYVEEKYKIPQSILFRVVSRKYSEEEHYIDLAFDIDAVPDAETITRYEFMLHYAAEKFGGKTPGWEIAPK